MPERCRQATDVCVHFLGRPLIDISRDGPGIVHVILATGPVEQLDRLRICLALQLEDARRLYEALGAVVASEGDGHA